jgi:hypothetical protein
MSLFSTDTIHAMPRPIFDERTESGLYVPMEAGDGLKVVDCGDRRGLSAAAAQHREDILGSNIVPGRFFGAASGMAATAILGLIAQTGGSPIATRTGRHAEVFMDFAADIADRATQHGLVLNQHSSTRVEGNSSHFNQSLRPDEEIDCAFLTSLGAIAHGMKNPSVQAEVGFIQSLTGQNLPTDEIFEGALALTAILPENLVVHRGAVLHPAHRQGKRTPFVVLDGETSPNDTVGVIYDLTGVRSDARTTTAAGLSDYHHTISLPGDILPKLMPELKLNPNLLAAAALVIGVSTRQALETAKAHPLPANVIPAEYASAA